MVTLEDVAREAGVSLATASRVLNGSTRRVGAALRARVESTANRLGYRVDATAQTLARGASNIVGLVVQDLTDNYFATIADGVIRSADLHDMVVTITTTYRDPEREIAQIATMRAQRARVVVIAGSRRSDERMARRLCDELDAYRSAGGRVALIGQSFGGVDTVAPMNREGAARLAHALAGLGHRRFAVLAGPPDLLTAVDRCEGFTGALTGLGLPPPLILHGGFDRDGGHATALEFLDLRSDVTCLYAVNDVMAVGALAAFRERGVRVPGDLSLAGFDDIAPLRDTVPPLTTVRLPLAKMGAMALNLALTSGDVQRTESVPGEVILRASVAALPAPAPSGLVT
ncbi:LacI family DNA-binding transcriptional regulator [Sphaerisporangium sp. B11E5]|uniref:LacI family DNA-binding transcriptional regulator n=1 Tax=Sphaerisporangium sp. B11E5 TaxID=3153563 RepID=UPI00325E66E6